MNIGDWVRRPGRRSKWHLTESTVAGDAFTRCGRRMDRVTASGGELQVSAVMPLTRAIGQPQLCKAGCEREAVWERVWPAANPVLTGTELVAEDDGSTAPIDDDFPNNEVPADV